jgi:hypothetical protein
LDILKKEWFEAVSSLPDLPLDFLQLLADGSQEVLEILLLGV